MASSVIHICVAKEVNKYLKRDEKKLLIGSIAPDISKQIGETKVRSHFLVENPDASIPNMKSFLDKYENNLNDDFVMGYYIHLYTDYLWFKYFITEFVKENYVYDLDGEKLVLTENEKTDYIYNDYTNINIKLIDMYNLDLSMFYEEIPKFKNIIKEIPMDKINIIIDKTGIIIENSKEGKNYVFDERIVSNFIKLSTDYLVDNLKNMKLI